MIDNNNNHSRLPQHFRTFIEIFFAVVLGARPTNLITFSGQDLFFIVDGHMSLDQAVRLEARRAAETGEVMVPVYQLLFEQ